MWDDGLGTGNLADAPWGALRPDVDEHPVQELGSLQTEIVVADLGMMLARYRDHRLGHIRSDQVGVKHVMVVANQEITLPGLFLDLFQRDVVDRGHRCLYSSQAQRSYSGTGLKKSMDAFQVFAQGDLAQPVIF